jgi:hypothetical protein
MKTSELTGANLDWAVAQCMGLTVNIDGNMVRLIGQPFDRYYDFWAPSTDWEQGGPIIERECIDLHCINNSLWRADCSTARGLVMQNGPTPLIAAMRCYVASMLGEYVEIPEGLACEQ